MNGKPLISIDKFSGSGQNGILYCEGFYPELENARSIMGEGYRTITKFNSSTTGFSDLAQTSIWGSIALSTVNSASDIYNLYVDNGVFGRIYAHQVSGSEIKDGLIYTSPVSGYCAYPDIIETANGNILFPSERYIGKGFRGKATGGSTTTLVDTTKNFVTLGFATNDKVTNLKTGIIYTITSITTTTNTNDTLNFSASGTNTTGANDEYIGWIHDNYDTNITKQVWQQNQTHWVKQFKQFGDQYLFTNGNYLGIISADESTIDATYKQLPAKHQAMSMSVNNDKIIVSANYNGRGVILLWDGFTDGWNSILYFDVPVMAFTVYKSGWVFVSGGSVYLTDGYQIQLMYAMKNNEKLGSFGISPSGHNAMLVYEDMLYCATTANDINFNLNGIYVIDLSNVNNGFTRVPVNNGSRLIGVPYSIFLSNRFSNFQTIEVGGYGFVDYVVYGSVGTASMDKSMIISISLPEPRRVTGVGLNISRWLKENQQDANNATSRTIQVSIGDGKRGLINRLQAKANGTTTEFTVNGTTWLNNEVGDELYMNDIESATFGDRTFITSIANPGTATETWTVSPALSGNVVANDEIRAIRVKSFGRVTVNYNKLNDEVMFYNPNSGILSNKLYIEIVAFGGTNTMPISINEIKVYGD